MMAWLGRAGNWFVDITWWRGRAQNGRRPEPASWSEGRRRYEQDVRRFDAPHDALHAVDSPLVFQPAGPETCRGARRRSRRRHHASRTEEWAGIAMADCAVGDLDRRLCGRGWWRHGDRLECGEHSDIDRDQALSCKLCSRLGRLISANDFRWRTGSEGMKFKE